MIVLMAGLPGTGKTTLARELARRTQGALLSKDEIRAALFRPGRHRIFREQDDFVMEVMLDTARFLLQKIPRAQSSSTAAPFPAATRSTAFSNLPANSLSPGRSSECTCSDESARRRLDSNPTLPHPARNRTFALYLEVKARFEPIAYPKTTINTDQALEECIKQALVAANHLR